MCIEKQLSRLNDNLEKIVDLMSKGQVAPVAAPDVAAEGEPEMKEVPIEKPVRSKGKGKGKGKGKEAEPELPLATPEEEEEETEDTPVPSEKELQSRCLALVRADSGNKVHIRKFLKDLKALKLKDLDDDGRREFSEMLEALEV